MLSGLVFFGIKAIPVRIYQTFHVQVHIFKNCTLYFLLNKDLISNEKLFFPLRLEFNSHQIHKSTIWVGAVYAS